MLRPAACLPEAYGALTSGKARCQVDGEKKPKADVGRSNGDTASSVPHDGPKELVEDATKPVYADVAVEKKSMRLQAGLSRPEASQDMDLWGRSLERCNLLYALFCSELRYSCLKLGRKCCKELCGTFSLFLGA